MKQPPTFLVLTAVSFGAQAASTHPERDFELRDDIATLPQVAEASGDQVAFAGNPERDFDLRGEVELTAGTKKAAEERLARITSRAFPNLDRTSM